MSSLKRALYIASAIGFGFVGIDVLLGVEMLAWDTFSQFVKIFVVALLVALFVAD